MIKIGIIGCGRIAQTRHIPEYAANANAELYGFFDVNQQRAKSLADQYGGRVYSSYEELLKDPEIDVVSVMTPNYTHAEISIAALYAGKHVLCEKPMAVTLKECEAMVRAAEVSGKKLMIGQNQRLTPAHKKVKSLIEEGRIGEVLSFSTVFAHAGTESWSIDGQNSWFTDKTKSCFGALADLGIHKTDLMIYLTGVKFVKASAVLGTLDKKDNDGNVISVDDNAFCTFIGENGCIGTMRASWTNYGREENATSVYGTKAAVHIYRSKEHTVEVEYKDGTVEYFDMDSIQTNDNQTASGMIDAFMDSILYDREPEISAERVIPAMKAVFACVESAESGGKLIDIQ